MLSFRIHSFQGAIGWNFRIQTTGLGQKEASCILRLNTDSEAVCRGLGGWPIITRIRPFRVHGGPVGCGKRRKLYTLGLSPFQKLEDRRSTSLNLDPFPKSLVCQAIFEIIQREDLLYGDYVGALV